MAAVIGDVADGASGDPEVTPGDPDRRGPWRWAVTWGVLARPGFVVAHVEAWDADEALVLAGHERPDLPRPTVAFLVGRG